MFMNEDGYINDGYLYIEESCQDVKHTDISVRRLPRKVCHSALLGGMKLGNICTTLPTCSTPAAQGSAKRPSNHEKLSSHHFLVWSSLLTPKSRGSSSVTQPASKSVTILSLVEGDSKKDHKAVKDIAAPCPSGCALVLE